ncbi:hypothetical protein AJ78_07445 [Emergomyces pasteurianus Ep9510]|uniref:Ribonuclease T2-like n=1 Tax=Emergomyces pasteurianus Ep9510 TaxID=1447872 RepID=A0A1J9PVH0_9EURO|nr:hypothetical protein AJ78_07445 [Emergomyces pasteurianus Ep9510]
MTAKEKLWQEFIEVAKLLKPSFPSPRNVLRVATLGTWQIPLWSSNQPIHQEANGAEIHSCPNPQLSCKVEFKSQDTCCFHYPGGLLLQTQFWDTDPPTGPEDSWTIHGLWPDHCDGSFDAFCDPSRSVHNLSSILEQSGRSELLAYMKSHWKSFRGDDENLWEHEWNKHGTCISTLEPNCYPDYGDQQQVVTYFQKAVDLFLRLPSYDILSTAGISPSDTLTYTLDAIEDTLKKAHGREVAVKCRNGVLHEIWYYFNVAGPLESGIFVPTDPVAPPSNCPRSGIRYKPKKYPPKKPSASETFPRPTGTPFGGKGNLIVNYSGRQHGCIISRGGWFAAGTCASFHTVPGSDDGFFLKSSKGLCAFNDADGFVCASDIDTPTSFTTIDGKLSLREQTTFYSDAVPKRRSQSVIYESRGRHPLRLEIYWRDA